MCGTLAATLLNGSAASGDTQTSFFEYDGSSWTAGGAMIAPNVGYNSGIGTQNNAISVGISGASSPFSQIYNGTSSVTAPLMATPRQQTGTTNSPSIEGAVFGGVSPPFRDATEEFTSETTAANIKTFSSS